ncbi:MAG: hypothetical protein KC646_12425 [Candidatus Cloacimonetes bacterium]|nr:hypothetical protein [Candidatus Cloacimonadota bacterium]
MKYILLVTGFCIVNFVSMTYSYDDGRRFFIEDDKMAYSADPSIYKDINTQTCYKKYFIRQKKNVYLPDFIETKCPGNQWKFLWPKPKLMDLDNTLYQEKMNTGPILHGKIKRSAFERGFLELPRNAIKWPAKTAIKIIQNANHRRNAFKDKVRKKEKK